MENRKSNPRFYCSNCRATSTFIKTTRGYCCIGDKTTQRPGCNKILTPIVKVPARQ